LLHTRDTTETLGYTADKLVDINYHEMTKAHRLQLQQPAAAANKR